MRTDPPHDAPSSTTFSRAPLVSVLIASRDGGPFLSEALASLEAQTWPNVEVIAVDDGSRDATPGIFDAFARRHPDARVIATGGIGLAGALARAAREARGELFARQDDDDVSAPERIARQVEELAARPEIDVLGSAASVIDERGRTIGAEAVPIEPAAIARALRRMPPFVHGSVMMRRVAYEQAGGYRAAFGAAQDYDLWLRMNPARMANLPEPLYAWRRHPGGVFMRARGKQLRFAALARTFAIERGARGADSIDLFERAGDMEAFLERYPFAGVLLRDWGERLARDGRAGEARRRLGQSLVRGGGAGALAWWLATWGIALTPRARRAGAAAEAA